jgi:hypothetical protein
MKCPKDLRGGLNLSLKGALHLLCGSDVEDSLRPWCGW